MNSITRSQLGKAIRGFALPLLLLLPVFATAQKLKERMAAQYQEVFDYPKVAAIYEDLMKSGKADVNDMRKLSLVYRKMNQPAKAEAVLMQMMGSGHENPEDIFTYAEQLRARASTLRRWSGTPHTRNCVRMMLAFNLTSRTRVSSTT
ncbi:MAG: hypothetical protein IPF78_12195 [Flavobacteriales bacterium]|nr:hypothetical protein [Flavobacteriales bacterium]